MGKAKLETGAFAGQLSVKNWQYPALFMIMAIQPYIQKQR